jgi:hypothetical protein
MKQKPKRPSMLTRAVMLLSLFALSSAIAASPSSSSKTNTGFEHAVRPISNPVYVDLPIAQTYLHPIFMYQTLPNQVSTVAGKLPVKGDFQLYALALEYAFNERLSLVASKDGYIDFNPDQTFSKEEGWANIAGGLKWAFYLNPEKQCASSVKLMVEVPTGNTRVFQGEGKGKITPSLSALKLWNNFQFEGTVGGILPFSRDHESTLFFDSWHVSYRLLEKLFPMIELNHFHVLNAGKGMTQFDAQAGGAVPGIARFEGGDLINLGAKNAVNHRDLVTLALGCRYRINESVDVGAAFELPLTSTSNNLMETRTTVDLVWRFM